MLNICYIYIYNYIERIFKGKGLWLNTKSVVINTDHNDTIKINVSDLVLILVLYYKLYNY